MQFFVSVITMVLPLFAVVMNIYSVLDSFNVSLWKQQIRFRRFGTFHIYFYSFNKCFNSVVKFYLWSNLMFLFTFNILFSLAVGLLTKSLKCALSFSNLEKLFELLSNTRFSKSPVYGLSNPEKTFRIKCCRGMLQKLRIS